MKTTKKLAAILFGVLAMMSVAAFAGPAGAVESGDGTGVLHAEGHGTAALHGGGSIEISGSGRLYIIDVAGDADINVTGNGTLTETDRGVMIYRGFDGTASITGSNVKVALVGRNIVLDARGTGVFYLRGEGTYTVNGHEGRWSPTGTRLSLGHQEVVVDYAA